MANRPGALAEGILALVSGDVDGVDAQAAAHHLADMLLSIRSALTRG